MKTYRFEAKGDGMPVKYKNTAILESDDMAREVGREFAKQMAHPKGGCVAVIVKTGLKTIARFRRDAVGTVTEER